MLDYFPLIHDDELLYSVIARFHKVSGNTDLKDTLFDIFDSRSVVPVIDLPCNLESLIKRLPFNISVNLIYENTVFPLYSPFMTKQRRNQLIKEMKNQKGNLLKFRLGVIAGSICRKNGIYYCPECAKGEIQEYGEAYLHRTHQVQGVHVCEKHLCNLYVYPNHHKSRLEFITLDKKYLNFNKKVIREERILTELVRIAQNAYILLNNKEAQNLSIEHVHASYLKALKERGYLTVKGNIRQRDVHNDFINHYTVSLLNLLESNPNEDNEYNWLKLITRKQKRAIHPIRHLLFMGFLYGGVKGLLKPHQASSHDDSPGLCLNPFCLHHRQRVVTDIIVSADYKTREPVLTYTCGCGFSYSRKEKDDIFKVGTIKSFGHVWEKKLIDVIHCNSSLRAMARQMGCDCKTVVKYAEKLGMKHLIPTKMTVPKRHIKLLGDRVDPSRYKDDVLNFIKSNPMVTRLEICTILQKQCSWLYRNDRDWYDNHLPKPNHKKNNLRNTTGHWERIDSDIVARLKNEYNNIMRFEKPVRVTKSLIGRRIGKPAYLEKKLDKLPKTKAFLNRICESVAEFQARRIDFVCSQLIKNGEELIEWKIAKLAGLRSANIVRDRLKTVLDSRGC